ncbi:hypothetical protein CTA1_5092 [Colletotrichum tanaceti]|uniref:Uncharacterized protein n=1 Tax=Colletotrichum tanaceti TaxID=1306861 RepID=A0A4V6DFY5_9PEZI|nr:hypothetical protein CTA1_5092 [Colletotrichum tanaceti]
MQTSTELSPPATTSPQLRRSSSRLFGDLDTAGGTEGLLEVAVDGELTGSEGTDHEETGTDTGVGAADAELLGDLDEAGGGAFSGETLGLVDLGEHGVGGLRDDGGGETGNETRAEVDGCLGTVGEGVLGVLAEDGLRDLLEDDELGHGNGSETGVESADTLVLEHLAEAGDETGGVGGLRDETDAGGLEGAQGNVGEELGGRGGGEVDGSAVVHGVLVANQVDGLLLEELVSSELQGALEEVAGGGRAEAGEQSAGTLRLDDLAETTDQTAVVGGGVELDSRLDAVARVSTHSSIGIAAFGVCSSSSLSVGVRRSELLRQNLLFLAEQHVPNMDWQSEGRREPGKGEHLHIDGSQGTVGDGAADSTGKGESRVEGEAGKLAGGVGSSLLDDGVDLGRAGGGQGGSHCV